MGYNICIAILIISLLLACWPAVVAMMLFTASLFTGWDVSFGLRAQPLPIVDIIRLHIGYDVDNVLGGLYVGWHYSFLQIKWREL